MRDRSEMSISDLICVTAVASTMTAGTLMVSLIALPSPQRFIPAGNMVLRKRSAKISFAREQIDDVSRVRPAIQVAGNLFRVQQDGE